MVADRKLVALSLVSTQEYRQPVRHPHRQLAQPMLRIRTYTGVPRKSQFPRNYFQCHQ